MDKDLVKKVIRMVLSTMEDKKKNGTLPQQDAVKIWPHVSPLSAPVVLTYVKVKMSESNETTVTITPYVSRTGKM